SSGRTGASGPAVVISDARGRAIRTMNAPAAAGLNSVTWDMRMDSAVPDGGGGGRGGRGGGGGAGRGGGAGNAAGPLVAPGKYSVAVRVQGLSRELRGEVTVTGDPNENLSAVARA